MVCLVKTLTKFKMFSAEINIRNLTLKASIGKKLF